MSASQDKKRRQSERAAGQNKRELANREAEERRRKEKRKWTIWTIVVVILVVAILLANSNLVYTGVDTVSIGGESYNNAEYQYYYYTGYYNFANSGYASLFFDTSRPLSGQSFSSDTTLSYFSMLGMDVPEALLTDEGVVEGATWADYFREVAFDNMAQVTALYEAAIAEGYTLSEEDAATIDEQIVSMTESAASANYPNLKSYLVAAYGKGASEKLVRGLMERGFIADAYAQANFDAFEYSEEELAAWYAEHRDEYDTFTYDYCYVGATTEEQTEQVTDEATGEVTENTTEVVTEATMAEAREKAEALLEVAADAEALSAAAAELGEEVQYNAMSAVTSTSLASEISEWMLDDARQEGDTFMAESENSGYYVVRFGLRDANEYHVADARHILVMAEDSDENGEYGETELGQARAEIDTIFAEWESGEQTEERFAELAEQYSEDGGSNTNGGLYENIVRGQMVTEFNDFVFDEARQPGDTGIVFGESSSYSGYHIIYFSGYGERYCDYLADVNLRNEAYSAWLESLVAPYEASTNFVFRFAQK